LKSRFCCFCRRPDEARPDQRQQKCIEIKILLLLPSTRWTPPWSKAA